MRKSDTPISTTALLREGSLSLTIKERSKRSGHVFISYAREDVEIANQLRTELEGEGFRTWMDEKVKGGEVWREEIKNALDASGAVVVLWSRNAVDSSWVSHEASYSMACGIYVPCSIEPVEILEVYGHIQSIDLFQKGVNDGGVAYLPGYKRLVGQLDVLMPSPIPALHRFVQFLRSNRLAIIAWLAALGAFFLLNDLSRKINEAAERQQSTILTIESTATEQMNAIDAALRIQVEKITETSDATAEVVREQARNATLERYEAMLLEDKEKGTGIAGRQKAAIEHWKAGRVLPGTSNLNDAEFSYLNNTLFPIVEFGPQCQLERAELMYVDLPDLELIGANLRDAKLGNAKLHRAKLMEAKLVSADLPNAELMGATLEGADLTGAKLAGADFSNAKLAGALLNGATSDESTLWPNGFDWEAAGVTRIYGQP